MKKFEVVDLAKRMIAINTVSEMSNLQLAELIKSWLEQLGFDVELQRREFMHGNLAKVNLIARLGPTDFEPLMLSAHMDTVPPGDVRLWDKDPFSPMVHQKKLFGLGSVDMKGSIAAMICAVEPLVKKHLRRGIIFGLTFDEEVGLIGAKYLVDSRIVEPRFILIGEPTMMRPVRIHKGHIYLEANCRGGGGHGSDPDQGVNAIKVACSAIQVISDFADELKGCKCEETIPAYATVNIGTINGGTKPNVIPSECRVCFDIRPIPGMASKPLIQEISSRLENIGSSQNQPLVSVHVARMATEAVSTDKLSEIITAAENITSQKAGGVSYGTDGSVLQELGSEILVLGPGSIDQAHKPNEFITLNQLDTAVQQFGQIIKRVCLAQEGKY